MSGPTVPVSGPEDGARERVDLFGPGPRPTVHSDQSWSEHLERQGEPVVAETTAGEAEDAVRLIAVRYRDPDIARFAINDYRDWVAARSGGAQDDGLRGRIEAETLQSAWEYAREATRQGFAEGRGEDFTRHWAATAGWLKHRRDAVLAGDDPNWPDAARALAGPDDARQDGGCEAVNPETGRRCVRPWPHDGMHQVADGRWFGDDAQQDGAR